MELILASGSPRRAELLKNCGYEFTVIKSFADESLISDDDPARLVEKLAALKAREVLLSLDADRRENAVVLGSDTVVVLDGRVLGKPKDKEDAFNMLRAQSGRMNVVHTGVAVARCENGEIKTAVENSAANVFFSVLSDEETEDYIRTGEPMDKAGAYGIQGSFSMFVERIEGDYFTIVGLPVNRAYRMLKEAGVLPRAFSSR